jgi:hypothetical protein
MEPVAVVRVVTVQTPAMFFVVFQHDVVVRVDERSARSVGWQIRGVMAFGAGERAL